MRRRTPAQGNALGFGIDRCALQGRRIPPPLQGGTSARTGPRGVAPGWHAPRRWRVLVAEFSSGEDWYEAIYKIASIETARSSMTPRRPWVLFEPGRHARACGRDRKTRHTLASPTGQP